MSDLESLIPALVLLPMAGFLLTAVVGRRLGKQAHWIPVLAIVAVWVIAMGLCYQVLSGTAPLLPGSATSHGYIVHWFTWIPADKFQVNIGLVVDEWRLLVAVDGDDDGKPDGRLGGCDGHDHQGDDRSLGNRGSPCSRVRRRGPERPERDDREVDPVEHQLDRHQHADRVASGQEPERADGEEKSGQDQVGVERVAHDGPPGSRFAR